VKPAAPAFYLKAGTAAAQKWQLRFPSTPPQTSKMSTADEIFSTIGTSLKADPKLASKIDAVLQFVLTERGAASTEWVVDCKACAVSRGSAPSVECVVTIAADDFVALVAGKLNPVTAYMSGRMKVKGSTAVAQKFAAMAKKALAQPRDATATASAAPAAAATTTAAVTTAAAAADRPELSVRQEGFSSSSVFEQMATNLRVAPALAQKVNGVFGFCVTGGASGASAHWTVEAKGASPSVRVGAPDKADCTITIGDTDLLALASGKLSGMSAYMSGKMKLKGSMGLAQKIGFLMAPPKSKL